MQNKNLKKYIRKLIFTFILILIVLSFFIHPVKNIEKTGNYDSIYNKDNKYGLYLSSFRAEIMGDYLNLNNIYSEAVSQNKRDFLGKSFIINAIQNNEKEAIIDAENEIKQNPSNIIPSIYLSYIDFKNGNYQKSLDRLNSIKNKSDTFIVKILKSWVLLTLEKNDDALDLLETEINNPAFENIVLINLGIMAELSGDDEYAEELYEEALTTKLNLFDIETIANFYIKHNRKQKAIDVVSDYYKKSQGSISSLSLLESLQNNTYTPYYIDTPQKAMAKSLFDISTIIITVFPSSLDLYLMYLNMVLDLDSNLYMASLMKAEVYKKYNKVDEYKTIVKSIPETSYLNLINKVNYAQYLLTQPKSIEEALTLYDELIKSNPAILQLYINVGDYYKNDKKFNTAINYYTKGIEQEINNNTLNAELYFARAQIYDILKNKEMTEKDLEKSIVLNSKNPVVLNYYAYFLLLNNIDYEKAFKLSEQVIAYDPLNPYYLDTYGWAFFKLGKTDDALKMLEYAKAIQPKNSVIIDHLGDIYWSLGRKQEAKYEWKKALKNLDTTQNQDELNAIKLNNKINYGI